MNNYTSYCTTEQISKSIILGSPFGNPDYYMPTTQQMANWLREEKNIEVLEFIHLEPCEEHKSRVYRVDTTLYYTFEHALLVAIDKALELVEHNERFSYIK